MRIIINDKLMVSVYQNFGTQLKDRNLIEILQEIKFGKFQSDVKSIQYALHKEDETRAKEIKSSLIAFTSSGTFDTSRTKANINTYSQIVCLDFDDIPAVEIEILVPIINKCEYTFASFISPSGEGLKVFIQVNSNSEQHTITYNQIANFYQDLSGYDFDPKCKDITRLCFVSYDPETYINEDAKIFEVQEEALYLKSELQKKVKHDLTTDELLNKCLKFTEQKEQYYNGNRNNFIFLFACNAIKFGIYEVDTLNYCINNFDLEEREIKITINSTYKNQSAEFAKFVNHQSSKRLKLDVEKSVYNAVELLARGEVEQQYLMEPIFPQKGSAVLAGKPDTGKSQFARQLCIQIALGEQNFIDFKLNPIHNRSIYVATEDNEDATRFLINKQFSGLEKQAVKNLRFIFADTMNQEEIIKNLNEQLTLEPVDLVVIDSFGDIFQGNDSNNNMAMRNTVKTFDKIGKEHNCLVIFVHHINKAAYRVAPGQEHIQGGSGLVQKVRLAIVLSEGEGNIRYFTVVKGNYCPKQYKENSLELNFSEETFLFSNTGNLIPTNELGTQTNSNNKDERYNELEEIAQTIFQDKLVSTGNFVKQFCEITGKSIPTAKRAHANLIKFGLIEKCNGVYRLKNSIPEENNYTSDDEDDDVSN